MYDPYLRIDCCCAQPTCYQPLTFDFQTNVVVPISVNINIPAHSCGIPAKNLSLTDVLVHCNLYQGYRGLGIFGGPFIVSDGVDYSVILDGKSGCTLSALHWDELDDREPYEVNRGLSGLAEVDYEPVPYIKSFINDIGNSNPFLRFDTKAIKFQFLEYICGPESLTTHVACDDVYMRYMQLYISSLLKTTPGRIDMSYISPPNVRHFVHAHLAFPLVTALDLRPFSDDYNRIYLPGDVWFRLPVLLGICNTWSFFGDIRVRFPERVVTVPSTGDTVVFPSSERELYNIGFDVSIKSYYGAVLDLPFPQIPGTSLQFQFLGSRITRNPIVYAGESLNNIFPDALQVSRNTTVQLTFLGFERSPSYGGVIDWYTILTALDERGM